MCTFKSKNRQSKGFTLLELLLVLGVIAVLALAAFIIYPKVQDSMHGNQDRQAVRSFIAEVESTFGNTGIDSDTMITVLRTNPSSFAPLCGALRSGGDGAYTWCWSSFGTPVQLATMQGGGQSGFAVEFSDLTPNQCLQLMSSGISNLGATDSYSYSTGKELDVGSTVQQIVDFCGEVPSELDISVWPSGVRGY